MVNIPVFHLESHTCLHLPQPMAAFFFTSVILEGEMKYLLKKNPVCFLDRQKNRQRVDKILNSQGARRKKFQKRTVAENILSTNRHQKGQTEKDTQGR
jgi:hypothetical protein